MVELGDVISRIDDLEESEEKRDKRVDRIEKAIFGMQDPDTLVWIPGILQNTADLVRAKRLVIGLASIIATSAVLNVAHSYGLSDAVFQMLNSLFSNGHAR